MKLSSAGACTKSFEISTSQSSWVLLHWIECLEWCLTSRYNQHAYAGECKWITVLIPYRLDWCFVCLRLITFEPKVIIASNVCDALNPFTQGACSKMCFLLLSPNNESKKLGLMQVSTVTIGNHLDKLEELRVLLQHLWLHGCCQVYCPLSNM